MQLNTDRLALEHQLNEAESRSKRYLDQIDMLTQENQRLSDLKTPPQPTSVVRTTKESTAPPVDDQRAKQLKKELEEKAFVVETLHQK
jgi:hypothetical protein